MAKMQGLIKGAFILAMGAFLSKLIGAIYRIPLTNVIGAEGLGLYQMVFPIYCVLLDFAGAGVPSALSKIIAERGAGEKTSLEILYTAIKVLSILGLVGTALMLTLSSTLAYLQGNSDAMLAYIFLAPSVSLVAIASCFRGYFQGKMNMYPTAITQVGEQVIKLVFGVLFASLFMPNLPLAVGGATLAVSLSELFALLCLYLKYKKERKKEQDKVFYKPEKGVFYSNLKLIVKTTVPVTLIGVFIPLSQFIDSFIIINLLNAYMHSGTILYGLLSGVAVTVINLPVAICYGLSQTTIPLVSKEKSEQFKNKRSVISLFITFILSLLGAIITFIFCPIAVKILFRSLSTEESSSVIALIKMLAPSIVFLALIQTENAVLIGKGKLYFPLIGLIVGIILKIILELILVSKPEFNIYGGAIALIACYFAICLINLIVLISAGKKHEDKTTYSGEYAN